MVSLSFYDTLGCAFVLGLAKNEVTSVSRQPVSSLKQMALVNMFSALVRAGSYRPQSQKQSIIEKQSSSGALG